MASVESFFVTRTMQAIEVLAFQSSTAPQIARALQVDARTARRLLTRLADDGWLTRTEGRATTYSLSLRVVALASHFAERLPLVRAASPVVHELHRTTGATARLTIPSYRSVLCLVDSTGDRPRNHLDDLIPAHANAGGKVLLAHRHPWRESVLELPLERLTDRTITDPDALRDECAVVRSRGYATEEGEYQADVASIAAPIRDRRGEVPAAITLIGGDVLGRRELVVAAAADVEAELLDAGV